MTSRSVAYTLTRLFSELLEWLTRYVPAEIAHNLATMVASETLRSGLAGAPTTRGVFKDAFSDAERVLRAHLHVNGQKAPGYLWRTVPLPPEAYLVELAGAYMYLGQVTLAGGITLDDQDFLVDALFAASFGAGGTWHLELTEPQSARLAELLDRFSAALAKHEASCQADGCDWNHVAQLELNKMSDWRYHYAKSAHRRHLEQEQQIHDPSINRQTVADPPLPLVGG